MTYNAADHQLERWTLWRLTERPDEIPVAALEPEDFTERALADWFREIAKRQAAGEPVEGIDQLLALGLVPAEELQKSLACETDWSNFWSMRDVESRSQFLWRCAHLRRLRYRRELVACSRRLAEAAEGGEDDLVAFQEEDEYLARLRDRIDPPARVDPVEQYRRGLQRVRISTGYPTLDKRIRGGVPQGFVTIPMANSKVGKTTFGTSMALRVALERPNEDAVFASCESTDDVIVEKMMCDYFGLGPEDVKRLVVGEDVRPAFDRTLEGFAAATERLHVWDNARTISEIYRRCAMLDGPISLLVIDYIQEVDVIEPYRTPYDKATRVVASLRPVAVDLRCAVVAMCQTKRSTQRWEPPNADDGRDTGKIEEVGDIVLGLFRPDWIAEQKEERRMCRLDCKILLNKQGYSGGVVSLDFDVRCQRISEPQQQGEIPV